MKCRLTIAAGLALVVFAGVAPAGCAARGSPVGIGNLAGSGQQGAINTRREVDDHRRQTAAAAGDIEQSSRLTWNDVWPWLIAAMVLWGITGVVIMYWIRRHSYLRQKPQWEQMKGKSCEESRCCCSS